MALRTGWKGAEGERNTEARRVEKDEDRTKHGKKDTFYFHSCHDAMHAFVKINQTEEKNHHVILNRNC